MSHISIYNSTDKALFEITKKIRVLRHLEPINENEEKEAFLAGKTRNPRFQYRELEYDPEKIKQKLKSLKIPRGRLNQIFKKRKEILLLANEVVKNRGRSMVIREISNKLHGAPKKKLLVYAEKLLKKISNVESKETVSSLEIKRVLEKELADYDLTDWQVEFSDKRLTSVYQAEKKITVCKDRKFTEAARVSLPIHEIGVHVLRAANGYRQPLGIFVTGFPGYLSTEEGLALYFEELTGTMNQQKLRNYAGRVIAVDSVCQELDFRQAFERLKDHGFTDDQTWNLAVRAYRGGGYLKDKVYLKGLFKIKEFVKKGGDVKLLYVGSIGIRDLDLVKELLGGGEIKKAKFLPKFYEG